MAKIIHLVGKQGSGKSTHAELIAKDYERRGLKCAGIDDPMTEFMKDRDEAVTYWPDADVIFLEHMPDKPFKTAPGDKIIRLETVPAN